MIKGTGAVHEEAMEGSGGGQGMEEPIRRVRGRRSTKKEEEVELVAYIERDAGARPRQL